MVASTFERSARGAGDGHGSNCERRRQRDHRRGWYVHRLVAAPLASYRCVLDSNDTLERIDSGVGATEAMKHLNHAVRCHALRRCWVQEPLHGTGDDVGACVAGQRSPDARRCHPVGVGKPIAAEGKAQQWQTVSQCCQHAAESRVRGDEARLRRQHGIVRNVLGRVDVG
jgi:hypothetical protein